MTIWEAILLGVIQGATEFLPVSSSGHSVLVPLLFNLETPSLGAVAIAHLGTLGAVLLYFRADLAQLVAGSWQALRRQTYWRSPDFRLATWIVVGTIPAVVVGFLFKDFFDALTEQPRVVAALLMGTALILVVGERLFSGQKQLEEMNGADAIWIGLLQALALFPGISRSGSTIMAGLFRGLNRELAARYSFLLGIPAIAGGGLLSLLDLMGSGDTTPVLVYLTVLLVSFAVGYVCIVGLLNLVRRYRLYGFAIYCVLASLFFLVWLG
jgi:undecaprenyl-diphosphatase